MRAYMLMPVLLLCLLCNAVQWQPLSARTLPLSLPLRPRDIYKLLSPETRTVSSGLGALAGLTLGLKKVLTGIFIYDVITANVTDLEETQAAATTRAGTAQEICFSAYNRRRKRNVADFDNSQYDDDDMADGYDDELTLAAAAEQDTEADRQVGSDVDYTGVAAPALRRANTVTCIVLLQNR